MNCPICKKDVSDTPDVLAMQACNDCASRIGIVPMPPATRPPKPCARCGGTKFLRAIPREHTSDEGG
jgi:hypothetical protein